MSSELRFDSTTHTYTVDGRRVPSVTQVLELAGLVDKTWFTDFGRDRGTYVHQMLELDDQGDLDEGALDPQLVPHLTAWRACCAAGRAAWTHIEHRMADATVGVAGTADRIGTFAGALTIADIKSGHPEDYIAIQLGGYAYLAELTGTVPSAKRVKRIGVFVRGDGSYRVIEYADRSDIDVFRAALVVAQWRLAHPRSQQEVA